MSEEGKRKWNEAVKLGLDAYVHRDRYAYFYGAKGQILTDAVMDALMGCEKKYFAKYTAEEIAQIKRNSRNKIGYDCSGFVGWHCTGDRQYSTGQINNCSKTTPELWKGVAGSILYTTHGGSGRHVGLDIGYGFCIDTAYESTDAAVREGRDSIRFRKISECDWEISGESNVLDYEGASER